jgi:hypothetical protein
VLPQGDPFHDGPVVVVTGRVASRIARPLGRLLREARDRGERVDDEVVAAVTALERASRIYAARRVLAGSVDGTAGPNSAELAAPSPDELSMAVVAERLGCGERNVTKLIARRHLDGRKVGRTWLVDAGSVARLLYDRSA